MRSLIVVEDFWGKRHRNCFSCLFHFHIAHMCALISCQHIYRYCSLSLSLCRCLGTRGVHSIQYVYTLYCIGFAAIRSILVHLWCERSWPFGSVWSGVWICISRIVWIFETTKRPFMMAINSMIMTRLYYYTIFNEIELTSRRTQKSQ